MPNRCRPPQRRSLGKEGDQIAQVIGFDAAVKLIEALPPAGSRPWRRCVYVPAKMRVDHMIAQVIGFTLACRLSAAFGGQIVQPGNGSSVQRARKEAAVMSARRAGQSAREIAANMDIPASTVRSIIDRLSA